MNVSQIIEFLLCLVENIFIYFFTDRLLYKRFKGKLITYLIAILNSIIIFLLPELSYLKIGVSIIAVTCFCLFLYKTKAHIASVFALLFIYILYIIDVITGNLISLITSESIISILFGSLLWRLIICIIVKALDFLVFLFIYKQLKKAGLNYEKKYWILFNIIMFVFLIITAMFMLLYPADRSDLESSIIYFALAVLFFIMSLIVIYFFTNILESNNRIQKYLILEAGYESVNESLLLQQEHIRRFNKIRHDIKNHLLLAHSMLKQNKYEDADSIITKTLCQTDSASIGMDISSGNSVIDAILSGKKATCDNSGIAFNCSLDDLSSIYIDILDISSVLSNLLGNAIEAAINSENPSIEIKIVILNNYLNIYVKNSFASTPQEDSSGSILLTTKKDQPELHGYGTQIIKEIAEKYSGNFKWVVDGSFFKAAVILYNVSKE